MFALKTVHLADTLNNAMIVFRHLFCFQAIKAIFSGEYAFGAFKNFCVVQLLT